MAADTGHGAAELYERHSPRVFGYCLTRLGGREDAEDATQLTFLHAIRGLRRGIVPAAEAAWLLAIARNVCLSRWASASRRSHLEAACDPFELERLPTGRDSRQDELIGLERALELLPEQQRRAVLLRDWRGLSYLEVAAELQVSHAAVETLIFRGRVALAEHLEQQPDRQRRSLRSLSALGWLLNPIKGAVTGAAAGAKLGAAVGAVVAVTGGGIAIGTTLTRPPTAKAVAAEEPRDPSPAVAGRAAAPVRATSGRASARDRTVRRAGVGGGVDRVVTAKSCARTAAAPAPVRTPPDVGPGRTSSAVPPAPEPVAPASTPAAVQREPAQKTAAAPPETPAVAAPAAVAPPLDAAPALPPLTVPSLPAPVEAAVEPVVDTVVDTVAAATEPSPAVVDETLASVPPLPSPIPDPPLPPVAEQLQAPPLLP